MTVAEFKTFAGAVARATDLITEISRSLDDQPQPLDRSAESEVYFAEVTVNMSVGKPDGWVFIHLTLNTCDVNVSAEDRELAEHCNALAKAFVASLIERFGPAERDQLNPRKLHIKSGDNLLISISGYPTAVTYICERHCVAVLPGGRRVPLNEVPIGE